MKIYLCALAVTIGIMFHFVTKLAELQTHGIFMTPWEYWRKNLYTSLVVVMGAYLFMALQSTVGELTYTSALLTGITCNSIGDKVRAKANAAVDKSL